MGQIKCHLHVYRETVGHFKNKDLLVKSSCYVIRNPGMSEKESACCMVRSRYTNIVPSDLSSRHGFISSGAPHCRLLCGHTQLPCQQGE